MKPISVLVAVASLSILATAACKKDEPVTSETNTTGAQIQPEQPAVDPVKPLPVQPQVTTGSATDTTTTDQSGMRPTSNIAKGKDAGVASDFPSGGTDLLDRDQQYQKKADDKGVQQNPKAKEDAKQDSTNHSTSLGDGKSGESTGGKGTYGGKATWGTGTPNKDTKMDQPTK